MEVRSFQNFALAIVLFATSVYTLHAAEELTSNSQFKELIKQIVKQETADFMVSY